ncbi:histone H3.v1-like [Xiphophorus maculatus]|uniref:histone H3.v1-like n=1 Tax=Xiphophorus maculatus TaxID=8083 RepID=UPI000C6D51E0|nr:histone H3.v1-like [Xiphophorus maculatus]
MQKIEKVQVLEPIQEESEQEDETVGRKEEEEKEVEKEDELPFQVGVETEEALAENEREEDDVPLMVRRPGRRSGSRKLESLIQIQFNEQTKETETSSVSDPSTHSTDLCEETAPLPVLGYERRLSSRRLRLKVSKTMWQKCTKSHQPKKRKSLRSKEVQQEPFPQWLVNLMVDIDEATSHQLVVE